MTRMSLRHAGLFFAAILPLSILGLFRKEQFINGRKKIIPT